MSYFHLIHPYLTLKASTTVLPPNSLHSAQFACFPLLLFNQPFFDQISFVYLFYLQFLFSLQSNLAGFKDALMDGRNEEPDTVKVMETKILTSQWVSVPTPPAQPPKGQTENGQTQHHEKSESGVHKGKCRQCPVRLLLLTANNSISSLESRRGFLTSDSWTRSWAFTRLRNFYMSLPWQCFMIAAVKFLLS